MTDCILEGIQSFSYICSMLRSSLHQSMPHRLPAALAVSIPADVTSTPVIR